MATYTYDPTTRTYRDGDGTVITEAALIAMRNGLVDAKDGMAEGLAAQLEAGLLTANGFRAEMQIQVKNAYLSQYLLGIGGVNQFADDDRDVLETLLQGQYGYLDRFVEEIVDEGLTQAAIATRAGLYFASSTQSYERARGKAWGIDLPAHPGDGSSECLTACRCSWSIEDKPEQVEATWRLGGASDNCVDCLDRSRRWNPLVFGK